MNTLFELPQIDEDGYFCGYCTCMNDPSTGEALIPENVLNVDPPSDDGKHWYRWNGKVWIGKLKPTTCDECVELGTISHTSSTDRWIEIRELCQKLVEADPTHYKISIDKNSDWYVEAIPEKTQAELKAEEKAQKILELQKKLQDTDYVTIKIAEGVAAKEDYADILAQREEWRNEINSLEAE